MVYLVFVKEGGVLELQNDFEQKSELMDLLRG